MLTLDADVVGGISPAEDDRAVLAVEVAAHDGQPAELDFWLWLARKRAFFSRFPHVLISHHLRVPLRLMSKNAARHVDDAHNAIFPWRSPEMMLTASAAITLSASSTEAELNRHSRLPSDVKIAEARPPALQSLMTWIAEEGSGS